MKIFFITSLIVALIWQTRARSMGPVDEIMKEVGMVKENLDPKKLGENVKMVGKKMAEEVKEGEQKLENIEKEAEGGLESAITMEQEAAKKAGAMIGSSLKRRSDKKSDSGEKSKIVKAARTIQENLDPKKLAENVKMVEKDMEEEVKEGEQKLENMEKEAEGEVKKDLDPKKLGENVKMVEKDMEEEVKEEEQKLENVEKEAEGGLESAIKMEQEAAKKAGAMIGSSLKRRSDKKSDSGEKSSKEHPAADPLKKLKFFLQFFLSNVMGQLAAIGRHISV